MAVLQILPYLDELYKRIGENLSITVQGLSDLFVANYGKVFDVEQLRVATTRLRKGTLFLKRGNRSSTWILVFAMRRVLLSPRAI